MMSVEVDVPIAHWRGMVAAAFGEGHRRGHLHLCWLERACAVATEKTKETATSLRTDRSFRFMAGPLESVNRRALPVGITFLAR